ncbi:YtxH domain-containing protein [Epilithonimonas sp. UC225_85]|uniref:YtxH domain-containing protein n=1 Tax=Epilithonimonas sp. UC225_85 TaxID=3350167 RepID=UPI0036D2C05E
MGNKTNGLLALLGLGALAWWKYKKSSPEDQQKVKDTINTAKENLTKFGNDLKDKASQTAEQLKERANETAEQFKNKAEEVQTDIQNSAQ